MKTITISVPFIYNANIVPPRCRNGKSVLVKDCTEVTIHNAEEWDLPTAFIIKHKHRNKNKPARPPLNIIAYDGRLWSPDTKLTENYRKESNIKKVINSIFHIDNLDWMYAKEKGDIKCREWLSDYKELRLAQIHQRSRDLLFIKGKCHIPCGEPAYLVKPFTGIYTEFGSAVSLFFHKQKSNTLPPSAFRIDQLDEAMAYAAQIARDSRYLGIIPCDVPEVKILMPEMIKAQNPSITEQLG